MFQIITATSSIENEKWKWKSWNVLLSEYAEVMKGFIFVQLVLVRSFYGKNLV